MLAQHSEEPWLFGPAFYFELREEYTKLGPYGVSVPVFSQAVLREYPGVHYLWGGALVEAFLSAGHTILCIDGFEEVSHIVRGREEDAVELLRRICATLPLGTRFIIACRASHFGSLDNLLNLNVWRGLSVRDTFEVVALAPFEDRAVKNYLGIATAEPDRMEVGRWLEAVLENKIVGIDSRLVFKHSLQDALRKCFEYPALLAAMVDYAIRCGRGNLNPTDLLEVALVDARVDYNIQMGKAQPIHYRDDGSPVFLGTAERMELLAELVWDIAERGEDTVDIHQLPPRVEKYFGIDLESAIIDVRTHTLLDIGLDAQILSEAGHPREPESAGRLHFAVPFRDAVERGSSNSDSAGVLSSPGAGSLSRAELLATTAAREAPVGTSSVSGAFLLARHIAQALDRSRQVPTPSDSIRELSVPFVDRWRSLGEIPLGLPAAGILREMLEHGSGNARKSSLAELLDLIIDSVARLAKRGDKSVFTSSLRYIGHNLEAMGLISSTQRETIDPWSDARLQSILDSPSKLPGYKMALIPAPLEGALPRYLREEHIRDSAPGLGRPFLLGVREVTNADFLAFLSSDDSEEWRVENITVAGGEGRRARSRYARFANEYYLYFWEEAWSGLSKHRPIKTQMHNPVGYVSWYACAAFCDWLTKAEKPNDEAYSYLWEDSQAGISGASYHSEFRAGYRLPAALEWSWAARGGRLDVSFPWELYPVALANSDLEVWLRENAADPDGRTRDCQTWIQKWRQAYRSAVLTMPKEHVPVLLDPLAPLGTSGMMGNVKEWCHDEVGENGDRRPILGATSFLGERSFNYDYGMTLIPQNTNPDVGFRISRPLSNEENNLLAERERLLESLSRIK
jgi:formylglycine-generating enzyme required for sulfatase activity